MVDSTHPQIPLFLKVCCAIFPPLVFSIGLLRLYLRARLKNWWWDDAVVVIGIISMIVHQVLTWSLWYGPDNQHVRTGEWYGSYISILVQIWTSRLSILYSVIRFTPYPPKRRIRHWIALTFMLAISFFIGQVFWICSASLGWSTVLETPTCNFTLQVPLTQLFASVFADSILIYLPLETLRDLSSAPVARRRVSLVYMASICLTMISLTHAAISLAQLQLPNLVIAYFECWVSLTICNLAAIVPASMQYFGKKNQVVEPGYDRGDVTNNSMMRFTRPLTTEVPSSVSGILSTVNVNWTAFNSTSPDATLTTPQTSTESC